MSQVFEWAKKSVRCADQSSGGVCYMVAEAGEELSCDEYCDLRRCYSCGGFPTRDFGDQLCADCWPKATTYQDKPWQT